MKKPFEISRCDLHLLRFYGAIESVIYDLEIKILKLQINQIGDWELILKTLESDIEDMQSLKDRMNKYLDYGDEE